MYASTKKLTKTIYMLCFFAKYTKWGFQEIGLEHNFKTTDPTLYTGVIYINFNVEEKTW